MTFPKTVSLFDRFAKNRDFKISQCEKFIFKKILLIHV